MRIKENYESSLSGSLIVRTARSGPLSQHRVLLPFFLLLLFPLFTIHSQAQGTPAGPIPPSYIGLTFNDADHFPGIPGFAPISFGVERFWDTNSTQWPFINTAPGVFNWGDNASTGLDWMLLEDYKNGVTKALYTLSRTPNWASANPSDTTCQYFGSAGLFTGSGASGQCWPPSDLNVDGTGTDAIWIAWVTGIASHVNDPTYLLTHADIKYWEIWNEFDQAGVVAGIKKSTSFNGTYAQLVRMTEDARCVITGKGTIHNTPSLGQSTACSATPIDPTAMIVMPSAHVQTAEEMEVAKNFLYCSDGATSGPPDYCNAPGAGAAAIDILDFHMKPGVEPTVTDPETEMQNEYNKVEALLQPAEIAKPLWNGEAGYASGSWTPPATGGPNLANLLPLQAAFVGRYALIMWSLGIQNFDWYQYDNGSNLESKGTLTEAGTAYQQIYNWLVGSTMPASCQAVGTQWTCGLTGQTGGNQFVAEAIWDTSQTCGSTDSTCTSNTVTVDNSWRYYLDLAGNKTEIVNQQVSVGIRPILLESLTATVTLSNLSQTYTGSPLSATATTNPGGLAVSLTYNGSTTPPTAAGSYTVVATVNDPNYAGSATGTLVIAQAILSVTADSTSQPYGATPVLTATISGFVGGDTSAVVSGAPALATTANAASLPGTYPITIGQGTLSAPNYSFYLVGGTDTVEFTASVPGQDGICNGAYNGTYNGNLKVTAGEICIFINGGVTGNIQQNGGTLEVITSNLQGNLQVNRGGIFTVTAGSYIQGDLQVQQIPAGSVTDQVCGSTVHGDLKFQNNGTAVLIGAGAPATCAGNTINGNLQIQNNTASASSVGNIVGNNLQIQNNTAATIVDGNTVTGNLKDMNNKASTQVFTNTVGGNLQCQGNSTINGGGNTAQSKQGQCSAF